MMIGRPSFCTFLTDLKQFRLLLGHLVLRDLRVRYKRSALGLLWAFAEPLVQMLIYSLVFSVVLRVRVDSYPVFVLVGVLAWGYFNTGVTYSLPSVTTNAALVKKIYFPLEILPLATTCGRLVHFLISLVLLAPFLVYYDIRLSAAIVWLPVIVAIQVVLVMGLALLLTALNTLYEDAGFLVNFAFSALFYLSPVLYPVDMVPPAYRGVYYLNPMAAILTSYRAVILDGQAPEPGILVPAALLAMLALVLGIAIFGRLKWTFAEVL